MTTEQLLLLSNIKRHIALDEEDEHMILAAFSPLQTERKQLLLQPGEISRHENFIVRGCFRTYLIDTMGREHTLSFAVEDWWTGDLQSFYLRKPTEVFVESIEKGEVLRVERDVLEDLYARIPAMERLFRILVTNALSSTLARMYEEHALSVEDRLRRCQQRYPWLEQRVAQKHIASFLGITPEFLSKTRKRMVRDRS